MTFFTVYIYTEMAGFFFGYLWSSISVYCTIFDKLQCF